MEKIKKILDRIIEIFCISIMGIMVVLVAWQVITRYFFNKPSILSEQTAQYLFVWLVMYGSAYVFGKREHMQISFLRDLVSPKWKKGMDILQEIIIVIFATTIMLFGGYLSSVKQLGQIDGTLQIPIGFIYSAIPISGLFIVFYVIYNIREIILTKEKN